MIGPKSFYNSKLGTAAKFGSPLSLLPVWNPNFGSNIGEWGVAIVGKLGGLFGSGATPGTNTLTTLSGEVTVGSGPELFVEGVLGAIEKFSGPAMAASTAVDAAAHTGCALASDPGMAAAIAPAIY